MASLLERSRCPACGSGAVRTLLSRDFVHPSVWPWIRERYAERVARRELAGRRHEVARCVTCRLLFQRYVLSGASLVRLYDDWWIGPPAQSGASPAELPPAVPDPTRGHRLLDLGAGDGRFCAAARENGWEVVAVEIAPRRLEHLRDLGIESWARVEDVPHGGLHVARCHQILEHLPAPFDTLRALAARLAPGGRIELSVPDASRMTPRLPCAYWSAGDDALRPLEHVNGFTPRALHRLAAALGLACVPSTTALERLRRATPLRMALVRPMTGGSCA